MRKALSIYMSDLKQLRTNWAAAVLAAGLIVLPSLYAWINVEASLDPYDNTVNLRVGVVNEDRGAELAGHRFHAGKEIINALRNNHRLGWQFVTKAKGMEGVRKGDYFATIVIPEDFSANLATIVRDRPKRAVIHYYENDKRNAIVPKITERGVSTLSAQVGDEFTAIVNTVLFSLFHEAGVTLEQQLPDIRHFETLLFRLQNDLPTIERQLDKASRDAAQARQFIQRAEQLLPKAEQVVNQGREWLDGAGRFFAQTKETPRLFMAPTEAWLRTLEELTVSLEQWAAAPPRSDDDFERWAATGKAIATDGEQLLSQLDDALHRLEGAADIDRPAHLRNALIRLRQTFADMQDMAMRPAGQSFETIVEHVQTQAAAVDAAVKGVRQAYEQQALPLIQTKWAEMAPLFQQTKQRLENMAGVISRLERLFTNADRDLKATEQWLTAAKTEYPFLARHVSELTALVAKMKSETDINELIHLLKQDPQAKGAFLAHPVDVKTYRLFPLPNYGSGMNPFYTVLAIWVGGLLLVSVLVIDPFRENGNTARAMYIGRLLTFWTLNLLQAFVVTVGAAMFLPHIFIRDPHWFVMFGLLAGMVFTVIIFTLVSLFGNVGKAMAIILLVLQIAGAGGTYPVELIPPFFRLLNPWLPFTYAIDLMREAVGGIVWENVRRDVVRLCLFAVAALLAGLSFQAPLSRWMRVFKEKVAESKLFH
jgi:putative membrane protein